VISPDIHSAILRRHRGMEPCPPAGRMACNSARLDRKLSMPALFWNRERSRYHRPPASLAGFQRLIAVGKPSTVLGEQVASADGRAWLSRSTH